MLRRSPRSTRTDPVVACTALFRSREKVRNAGQVAPRVRRPAGHIVCDEQLHPRRAGTRGEDGSQFGMQRIILLGAVVVLRAQQIVAADRRAEALPEFRRQALKKYIAAVMRCVRAKT